MPKASARFVRSSIGSCCPGGGVRAEEAALDVVEVHRAAVAVAAALDLAVELGHELVRVHSLGERVGVRAVRRGDHVALLERTADPDGDGLLPNGDGEGARELPAPEAR